MSRDFATPVGRRIGLSVMTSYVHSLNDEFLLDMLAKHQAKLAFKIAIAADYNDYALTDVIEVGPLDGPSRWHVPPRSGWSYTPKEVANIAWSVLKEVA